MSGVGGISNSLIQGQLAGVRLGNEISYRVAAKTLDAARDQGAAVLQLLDAAADVGKGQGSVTLGAIASGLGQNLDVSG